MVSSEEIKNIAKLSNIEIKDNEIEEMREKFSSILEYIKKLQELDVSNIEETASVIKLESIMREDVPQSGMKNSFLREKNGYLEVNKILYNED